MNSPSQNLYEQLNNPQTDFNNDLLTKLSIVQTEYDNYKKGYKFKEIDLKNAIETNNQK